MSYHNNNAMGSGSRSSRRTVEFGRTNVVRPKGRHRATFVWLHSLATTTVLGFDAVELSEDFPEDMEGLEASAMYVMNLLSSVPADEDEIVPHIYGDKSSCYLSSARFRYVTFKSYDGIDDYTVHREMGNICYWITSWMWLEG
ncbi:hypothetical protein MLD38_004916 [Melastoma candidum]|uniref:Uncharacterized protein n=1 Tax=Melastoma candidum TaxID=119954 RepID=A0ACB9S8S2_9MYRT|nr:hypothetical protein MLD38_004916 [Melastoma candidum]